MEGDSEGEGKDGNKRQIPAYPRAGNPMGADTGVIPRPRARART
jgi:hypothetical protein